MPINTSRTPGTTSGLLEASGDSFTVTFSEPINPGTIPGTTTISESDPAGVGNDTLQIVGLTNGQINLGANNYVGDDGTTASFTSSTLTLSGGNTVVKATVVGTCSGTGCASLAIGRLGGDHVLARDVHHRRAGQRRRGELHQVVPHVLSGRQYKTGDGRERHLPPVITRDRSFASC